MFGLGLEVPKPNPNPNQAHPSLEPLLKRGESIEHLERMIDFLFSFHDGTSPMMLIDGPLRCPSPPTPGSKYSTVYCVLCVWRVLTTVCVWRSPRSSCTTASAGDALGARPYARRVQADCPAQR